MSDQHEPNLTDGDAARARRLDILRAMAASLDASPPVETAPDVEPPKTDGATSAGSTARTGALPPISGRSARQQRPARPKRTATPRQRAGTALITAGVALLALVAVISGSALALDRLARVRASAPTAPHILSTQLAGAIVYIASNNGDASHLYALNALTGKQVWRFLFGSSHTTPVISGTTVYTASSDGNIYALDTRTGRPLWMAGRPDRGEAYLALSGTALYAVDDLGIAYAFDATTGKTLWQVNGVPDGGVNDVFYSPPAVADGLVIASAGRYPVGDGAIIALDAATGEIRWRTPSAFAANGEPVVANGVVYVTATDGSITALNVATGSTVWSARIGSSFNSGVAISGNTIYAFAQSATMYAINGATGAIVWKTTGKDSQGGYVNAAPRVAAGVVYFCSQGGDIFAVSASRGSVLWKFRVGSAIVSTPAVLDGAVYFGDDEGNLYALRARDGVQAWTASLDSSINASPAIAP